VIVNPGLRSGAKHIGPLRGRVSGKVANPRVVADLKEGKLKDVGALIGQAKKRNPNVDPGRFRELCIQLAEEM
jgi:hypothetical protein